MASGIGMKRAILTKMGSQITKTLCEYVLSLCIFIPYVVIYIIFAFIIALIIILYSSLLDYIPFLLYVENAMCFHLFGVFFSTILFSCLAN